MDPPKINFFTAQLRVPVCYDISRYLTDKYFDIVWGCPPPGTSKNQVFEWLNLGCQFALISADIYQKNILVKFGGAIPWGPPQMDPPKINFLNGLS